MNKNLKILVEDNKKLLDQVIVLLGKVNDDLYNKKSNFLIKHSIGQHFRHIYAFYYQFINGIVNGIIDYDSRIRDSRMESDCKYMLKSFSENSSKLNINKNSKIILSYQLDNSDKQEVDSIIERDPAASSRMSVILLYPTVHILFFYKISNFLWKKK